MPYNVSIPIILYLFKQIRVIKDMNFMLQKEVANRLIAKPGNKNYGRLSVLSQYYCNISIKLPVYSKSFFPIPKVDSAFVNFIPYTNNSYFLHDVRFLSYITKFAFQQRRKILRHSLGKIFSINRLIKLGVNPQLRAENISVSQYCCLANYLYHKNIK